MLLDLAAHAASQVGLLWLMLHLTASVLCGILLAPHARIALGWAILISVLLPGLGPVILVILAIVRRGTGAATTPVAQIDNAVLFGVQYAGDVQRAPGSGPAAAHASPAPSAPQPFGAPAWGTPPQTAAAAPQQQSPGRRVRIVPLLALGGASVAALVAAFLWWAGLRLGAVVLPFVPAQLGLVVPLVLLVIGVGAAAWWARARPSTRATLIVTVCATTALFLSGAVGLTVHTGEQVLRQAEQVGGSIEELVPLDEIQQYAADHGIDIDVTSGAQGAAPGGANPARALDALLGGELHLPAGAEALSEQLAGLGSLAGEIDASELRDQAAALLQEHGVTGAESERLLGEIEAGLGARPESSTDGEPTQAAQPTSEQDPQREPGSVPSASLGLPDVSLTVYPGFWVALSAFLVLLAWAVVETVRLRRGESPVRASVQLPEHEQTPWTVGRSGK